MCPGVELQRGRGHVVLKCARMDKWILCRPFSTFPPALTCPATGGRPFETGMVKLFTPRLGLGRLEDILGLRWLKGFSDLLHSRVWHAHRVWRE